MKRFGSHNSWSYRPVQWYLKPIQFMGKCQENTIYKQLAVYNITVFDLRIRLIKDEWHICHGIFDFGLLADIYNDLKDIESKKGAVRVILEMNKEHRDQEYQQARFITTCKYLEENFPNIHWFGGNRKYDWVKVYEFKTKDLPLLDKYSSTTSLFKKGILKRIDDLYPRLYAKLYNKKNFKDYLEQPNSRNQKVLLYDFVGKYE